MKRPLLIMKHNLAPSKHHKHIGMMIVPTIDELERHRHQISIVAIELRPQKDSRMRAVSPWKLDDLDTAMQVERDEVARHPRRFVAHKGIDLEGAWPSIVQIVQSEVDPCISKETQHSQDEGK